MYREKPGVRMAQDSINAWLTWEHATAATHPAKSATSTERRWTSLKLSMKISATRKTRTGISAQETLIKPAYLSTFKETMYSLRDRAADSKARAQPSEKVRSRCESMLRRKST